MLCLLIHYRVVPIDRLNIVPADRIMLCLRTDYRVVLYLLKDYRVVSADKNIMLCLLIAKMLCLLTNYH
jgi:hypothetical protein